MTLLVSPAALAARRAKVAPGGPLAALADSLAADLDRAVAAAPRVPTEKALLTRTGGRCARDGALLVHDPYAEHEHRCPRCGAVHRGEAHRRWWIVGQQLWLAERAVHAAALHALRGAPAYAAFAARVLDESVSAYLTLPNRDNVLGPTRPFFSTYLESLWLLHLCVALDLLEAADAAGTRALGGRVRDRLVAPSAALVAGYPEGRSNRQAWNAAARLAAARLLGADRAAEAAVHGEDGVRAVMEQGLLADGAWYEGENYHQFAHRGLWYGVQLAARAGLALPDALLARFDAGFAVPFEVALPDATFPSRRDSQYAVSLRQWRWAEWAELGRARTAATGDETLARAMRGALAVLYAPEAAPAGDTGRWRATGEAERNEPPAALARPDLGWKSLLLAAAEPPAAGGASPPASRRLDAQGFAVLRAAEGALFASLDYGEGGGGHGHPDRLNVVLVDGPARWVDDPGAGSYVERTLHWYRSTLAHCAPLVDGASQPAAAGRLLGAAREGAVQGIAAAARIAPGVHAARTLLVVDDAGAPYVVDRVVWRATSPVSCDLPLPLEGALAGAEWAPFDPGGRGGLEDGFDFVREAERTALDSRPTPLDVRAYDADGAPLARGGRLWIVPSAPATLWRGRAPGPPSRGERGFHVVRTTGTACALLLVWDCRGVLAHVAQAADGAVVVTHADGRTDRHESSGSGWRLARRDRAGAPLAEHLLALPGDPPAEPAPAAEIPREPGRAALVMARGAPAVELSLGAEQYRRSEDGWQEAGAPSATVRLALDDAALEVCVDVVLHRPTTFVAAGAENLYDNERADVNGDGLQLAYRLPGADADDAGALAAWLLVPEPPGDRVRITPTTTAAAAVPLDARWRPTAAGWALVATLPVPATGGEIGLDVIVNEMPPGRTRRRGQLVLGGAAGEFVYLRGDRHDAARALRLVVPPAT